MAVSRIALAERTAASALRSFPPSMQNIQGQSVHIKIHPRPSNLTESREVLRVLQRYGEVTMYKHLKYETFAPAPNTALAIYQSASAAQKLIDASPLRFELEIRNPSQEALNDSYEQVESDGPAEPLRGGEIHGAVKGASEEETNFPNEEDSDISDELHPTSSGSNLRELHSADDATFLGLKAFRNWGSTSSLSKASPSQNKNPPPPKPSTPNPTPTPTSSLATTEIPIPQSRPLPTSSIPPSPPQYREFQLTISRSTFNHQGYIERQGYYGGFTPDTAASMVASDLEKRVPSPGMADCRLKKEEAPARIVARWREKAAKGREKPSLKEVWRKGREREKGGEGR